MRKMTMTKFRDSLKAIKSRISDWILLAYVIWFIKMDEYRDKLEQMRK